MGDKTKIIISVLAIILSIVCCHTYNRPPGGEHCRYILKSNDKIEIIDAVGYVHCSYPDGGGGGQWISFDQMVGAFYDEFYHECKKIKFGSEICQRLKSTPKPRKDEDWVQFGTRVDAESKPAF